MLKDFQDSIIDAAVQSVKVWEHQSFSATLKTKTSIWRVTSAMQKSIRRGKGEAASKYAQAILHGGQEDYLWRRLPIIALEDVGPANYALCATVLAFCRFSKYRAQVDKEKLVSWLVTQMAVSLKSRALADLICLVPSLNQTQAYAAAKSMSPKAMLDYIVSGKKGDDWEGKAITDTFFTTRLLGDRSLEKELGVDPVPIKSSKLILFDAMGIFLPDAPSYCMVAASKKGVYNLHAAIPVTYYLAKAAQAYIEHCAFSEPYMIKGLPEQAYDQHTLEGKRSLAYLAKSFQPLKEFFEARPDVGPVKALGMMLFQEESALLDNLWFTTDLIKLRNRNDAYESTQVGLSVEEGETIRKLLQSPGGKEALRLARIRVVEGKEAKEAYKQKSLP